MLNLASLNQRVNALTAKTSGPGGSQTLSQVLQQGNGAGSSDIDMNNQSILACDDIELQTINGIAVAEFQDTLNQVLINGNTATGDAASISLFGGVDDLVSSSLTNTQLVFSDSPHTSSMSAVEQQFSGATAAAVLNEAGLTIVDTDVSSILSPTSIAFTDTKSTTLNTSGLTTTESLTLDIGTNLILNGSLTETTAGGYSGEYLKLTINGVVYKIQLLVE